MADINKTDNYFTSKNNALKIKPLRGKNKIDALFKKGLTAHSSTLLLNSN